MALEEEKTHRVQLLKQQTIDIHHTVTEPAGKNNISNITR